MGDGVKALLRDFQKYRVQQYLLRAVAWIFIPEIVRNHLSNENVAALPKKPCPTAWLDGLRGCAAGIVVLHHITLGYTVSGRFPWGWKGSREYTQLPFVALFTAGPGMVFLFFVISGYVLSIKTLKRCRAGDLEGAIATLSSSTFRRALRIFIPPFVTTFCVALLLYNNWCNAYHWAHKEKLMGLKMVHADRKERLSDQIWDWYSTTVLAMMNVWDIGRNHFLYDPFLWSLRNEFQGSMLIFICLVGLARVRPVWRVFVISCIMVQCIAYGQLRFSTFLLGVVAAELALSRDDRQKDTSVSLEVEQQQRPVGILRQIQQFLQADSILQYAIFFFSLCLLSEPTAEPDHQWGFGFMIHFLDHVSQYYFPLHDTGDFLRFLGAGGCVYSVCNSATLRRFFSRRFPQHLGKVSFMMYIIHGPTLFAVAPNITNTIWGWTGYQTPKQRLVGKYISIAIQIPLIMRLSEIAVVVLDVPSMKFSRWLEMKLLRQ